jgi:cell division protein YceG involved in septum cleavage
VPPLAEPAPKSAPPLFGEVAPPIEQPARVEPPPVVEEPARVELPPLVEQPARVELPPLVAQPLHVEPPPLVEQPVSVEPPLVEPPADVEEPALETQAPVRKASVPARMPPVPGAPRNPAGASAGPRRTRSLVARLAALLALVAVIAAVILLLHGHATKTVSTLARTPVVKVLIPEGKTRMQIAQIATADGLKGNYRVASRHSPLLEPTAYGAKKGTPDLEGFLFPATYDMDPGASVNRLVEEQLTAFRENFGSSEIARARSLHVTPYQLLIVASMIEREAQVPGDRSKIAAVIYNRLAQGMPLGIDASIYYAIELKTGVATYTHELTEAQLHINSAYNTRTHVGLPPTPISNPGMASIEAAAHPDHDAYLYYVAGADGCGEQVFSNTLAEFETNAAAYKAAVARNGGRPPACKHTLTGTSK